MNYWVIKAASPDGAIIDALPEGAPSGWQFGEGVRLGQKFPSGGKVAFSDHFTDRRKVYDFVQNTLGVLIVSTKVRQAVEALALENVELLPITLCNHQWKPVEEGYCILNVLGSQDAINMKESTYDLSPITKTIANISNLVLQKDMIDSKAELFRARNMLELILMTDRVHDAFVKKELTGFVAHPAEGYDDILG